ncbi:pseudouridine synthase [Mucilaginibacter sp.]|uniref:pseudouridine synthase n=1 Tax=Mucilaginibacter sp. TaxID=1882438 RepID=UPI0035BC5661
MSKDSQDFITYFLEDEIKGISTPHRFTYPFYYEPHPLAQIATLQLQQYLQTQTDIDHNFGMEAPGEGPVIGKMFGVLVVQDRDGRMGYLSAFSGKIGGTNNHSRFVPPVFDMLVEDSFFLRGQEIINNINQRVKTIESNPAYQLSIKDLEQLTTQSILETTSFKKDIKNNKNQRKKQREIQKSILSEQDYALFEADLIRQSLHDKHQLNVLQARWQQQINNSKLAVKKFEEEIEQLKSKRREGSAMLQQQLFDEYYFLNIGSQKKSLGEIFADTTFGKPPAAAGECATPKLLQFAFLNGYKPIAMAEFWWGASPKSEIRQHKQFYPACTGKCKPILQHMLVGIPIDDNPLLKNEFISSVVEIVYQDDSFVVVNKPADLRSVPGVNIQDSVYTRLGPMLGIEPLMIHRLDMGTSGILVVAKAKEAHKFIQSQFLKRTILKRYVALLSGTIPVTAGEINLPLRGDLDNRPRQLVCYEFGKKAITRWKVIEIRAGITRINFWPLTGRTHQLRMHAAHQSGLNAPIMGDDLYGTKAERLYLHAAQLQFVHPVTKQLMNFEVPADF